MADLTEMREELEEVHVVFGDGHSGRGWYSYSVEYPGDGAAFWGSERPSAERLRAEANSFAADPKCTRDLFREKSWYQFVWPAAGPLIGGTDGAR